MTTTLDNDFITIEAQVERDFEPDMFRLEIVFEGNGDERRDCVDSFNSYFEKVCTALTETGISAQEIKSGSFIVSTHYDWLYEKVERDYDCYRRRERIADGFEYRGECSVEHEADFDLLANIWNALQELDAGFTFEITYKLEKPDECEKELLRSAVAEARNRAETLAVAAGSGLGRVSAIHYRFNHASGNYPEGAICKPCVDDCCGAGPSAPEFNPESITVYCDVTIAWALE